MLRKFMFYVDIFGPGIKFSPCLIPMLHYLQDIFPPALVALQSHETICYRKQLPRKFLQIWPRYKNSTTFDTHVALSAWIFFHLHQWRSWVRDQNDNRTSLWKNYFKFDLSKTFWSRVLPMSPFLQLNDVCWRRGGVLQLEAKPANLFSTLKF